MMLKTPDRSCFDCTAFTKEVAMAKMVCVGRYDSREDAEIAKIALANAGIEAAVSADDVGGAIHLVNGVEVLVMEDQVAAATEIIPPGDRPGAKLPKPGE